MTTIINPRPHGTTCICDICVPREDDGFTAYMDELYEVEKANGIKRTSWSIGNSTTFPVAKLTPAALAASPPALVNSITVLPEAVFDSTLAPLNGDTVTFPAASKLISRTPFILV
jgi:hypothetical protein